MKSPRDLRHRARMKLVETFYAKLLNPQTLNPDPNVYKFDLELYEKIYTSIEKNRDNIDNLIVQKSKRNISDIKSIEQVVLQITLAESYFEKITPYKVAIDEAIELSREYSDEASASFVSGVLGATFNDKN